MIRFAACIAAALITSAAGAQDISIRMDAIGADSSVVFSAGPVQYTTVFRGWSGEHYEVETFSGQDAGTSQKIDTHFRDAKGQAIRRERVDGTVITYEPHDCRRTLGTCRYIEIHETGRFAMQRVNELTETGFSFIQTQIRDDGTERIMASGSMEFDDFGMLLIGKWSDHVRGGGTRTQTDFCRLQVEQRTHDFRTVNLWPVNPRLG